MDQKAKDFVNGCKYTKKKYGKEIQGLKSKVEEVNELRAQIQSKLYELQGKISDTIRFSNKLTDKVLKDKKAFKELLS